MGILNRTPDSFYDRGATYDLDVLLRRADDLVAAGADILDVGGVKAGPGPDVTEAESCPRWKRCTHGSTHPFRWTPGGRLWRAPPTGQAR
jgi:dihydropteroate synthase